MAKRHTYETGKVYGCVELLGLERSDKGRLMARVRCVHCGRESLRVANGIFCDKYNSCTCAVSKHGLSNSRIYSIYHNMLDRCFNERCAAFFRYGATGIRVCDEWLGDDGFQKFYQWSMEHGYTETMTIDRIDSTGNYCPENCQWITKSENTARANRTCQHRKADRGTYYGISPDGAWFVFENASQFAREHSELTGQGIRKSANGGAITHRGWRFGFLSNLDVEPQSTIESAD